MIGCYNIYGHKKIDYYPDEFIVLCLVRNSELHIKPFIEHYLSLGFKHIIFLDNKSTDNTVSIAQDYPKVTILQTKLHFQKYQYQIRQFLINKFSKNRWSLYVDIDEFFDWPFSNIVDIKSLIKYLTENNFTAVTAQILDMFSDKPMGKMVNRKEKDIKGIYKYYDTSNIEKTDYSKDYYLNNYHKHFFDSSTNIVSNKKIQNYYNGIRQKIFHHRSIYRTCHSSKTFRQ